LDHQQKEIIMAKGNNSRKKEVKKPKKEKPKISLASPRAGKSS